MKNVGMLALGVVVVLMSSPIALGQKADQFVGSWALTIPGGGAGWLGVTQQDGYLDASILWGGGSVVPVDSVWVDGDTLYVTRLNKVERKDAAGKVVRTHQFVETLEFEVDGDKIEAERYRGNSNGLGASESEFSGKRIPDLPAKPDLSKVKFGEAKDLLANGLADWTLTNEKQKSAWRIDGGVLINDIPAEHPGISYGNLRTKEEFEDFNLTMDILVPKGSNSGVYLRGIYEVQVLDSYGKPLDSHNMGAIYSRITPSAAAEKPAGEWQTMDMTLVDRHITVKLNGTTIIDNAPLLGCTGGALWSDEFRPGPIYLQGDHGAVQYRNIAIRPVE